MLCDSWDGHSAHYSRILEARGFSLSEHATGDPVADLESGNFRCGGSLNPDYGWPYFTTQVDLVNYLPGGIPGTGWEYDERWQPPRSNGSSASLRLRVMVPTLSSGVQAKGGGAHEGADNEQSILMRVDDGGCGGGPRVVSHVLMAVTGSHYDPGPGLEQQISHEASELIFCEHAATKPTPSWLWCRFTCLDGKGAVLKMLNHVFAERWGVLTVPPGPRGHGPLTLPLSEHSKAREGYRGRTAYRHTVVVVDPTPLGVVGDAAMIQEEDSGPAGVAPVA